MKKSNKLSAHSEYMFQPHLPISLPVCHADEIKKNNTHQWNNILLIYAQLLCAEKLKIIKSDRLLTCLFHVTCFPYMPMLNYDTLPIFIQYNMYKHRDVNMLCTYIRVYIYMYLYMFTLNQAHESLKMKK